MHRGTDGPAGQSNIIPQSIKTLGKRCFFRRPHNLLSFFFSGNFWILDADGLLTEARVSSVDKLTQRFARPAADGEMADGAGVEEVRRTP